MGGNFDDSKIPGPSFFSFIIKGMVLNQAEPVPALEVTDYQASF
jgi:hypothetical protein